MRKSIAQMLHKRFLEQFVYSLGKKFLQQHNCYKLNYLAMDALMMEVMKWLKLGAKT